MAPRFTGLSPLARGNRGYAESNRIGQRPIPARAGEPTLGLVAAAVARAYPRSRGGTSPATCATRSIRGLSPLARGNLSRSGQQRIALGPIPARAGEPRHSAGQAVLQGAYPRSRGGTLKMLLITIRPTGLSPLARGNRRAVPPAAAALGPIPARAGEPFGLPACCWLCKAYPRSRGGTTNKGWQDQIDVGLSPLARGNLLRA